MAAPTAPVLTGGAKAKLDEAVFGLERNLLLVTGAVPGPTGGLVFVREDR